MTVHEDTGLVQLDVAADLESIRSIGPWLKELLADHEHLAAGLELALQELAVNVIEHGYGPSPEDQAANTLILTGEITSAAVTIRLLDGAEVFAGGISGQAGRSEPGEVTVGGFGLMIIEQITDQFRHDPRPAGGNEWTLVCHLS